MRYVLLFLALLLVQTARAEVDDDAIHAFTAKEIEASGAPGVAYAIIDNGQTVLGAHGEIRSGSGQPVRADTPFLIGSVSKSFTAMAVMKLVETGKIDLDASVSLYLEDFQNSNFNTVTIRQLLSHTSGFSTRQGNDSQGDKHSKSETLQERAAYISRLSPQSAPGMRWQYSNANYLVLGAVIEAESGQDYERFIQTEIFDPIGMTDSHASGGFSNPDMAIGHQPWFAFKRPIIGGAPGRISVPAGGIVSTARDLSLYLMIMMNETDDVISAKSKAEMMRPASGSSPYYGLGWAVDSANGIISHTGLTPGIETLAVFSPTSGKGAIVLVNANSGMGLGDNTGLFQGMSSRALGLDTPPVGRNWGVLSLYLMFALLPLGFGFGIAWASLHQTGLRAKSGVAGLVSLWFPLATTLALAWVSLWLMPALFGVSLQTFSQYQPDFTLLLVATAATGLAWAIFRLWIYHSGKCAPSS